MNIKLLIIIVLLLFNFPQSSYGATEWQWTDGSGRSKTYSDLIKIIQSHKQWLESNGTLGIQADLSGANLSRVDLSNGIQFSEIISNSITGFSKKNLFLQNNAIDMFLYRENRIPEDLVHVKGIDLRKAIFKKTNLSNSRLSFINLESATISECIFTSADLRGANLREAKVYGTDFNHADFTFARLSHAEIALSEVNEVKFRGADLSHTFVLASSLSKTSFRYSNLSGANFLMSDLSYSDLTSTDMTDAGLNFSDLANSIFEPNLIPEIKGFASARNIQLIQYDANPNSIVQIRKELKDDGYRKQEREITYALKHHEQEHFKTIERVLSYIFFDLTCQYGMSPLRPIIIIYFLYLVFAVFYLIAIKARYESGLFAIWPTDAINPRNQKNKTERVTEVFNPERIRSSFNEKHLIGWPIAIHMAFQFSLLSAFQIGWKDLNFENWVSRIGFYENRLQATGWVKFLAGIQSLASTYLFALWVLTYFGRPFE
jgi:uncharacterized protein YjbI with pentapeptide repeats